MKTDEFEMEQPDDNKVLFRYMDKWKFVSLLEEGLIFTNAKNQEDENDCTNPYEKTGYTIRENNVKEYKFLSCWTLDDNVKEEKVYRYCCFMNKDKSKECNYAYVVKTTYRKLIDFIETICGPNKIYKLIYIIRSGIVKYEYEKKKGIKLEGIDDSSILKTEKLEGENEFRLFMELGSSVNKYDEESGGYKPQGVEKHEVQWLPGNPKDFLIDVYEYNKNSKKFKQIGVPDIPKKTIKHTSFQPYTA